MPERPGNRPAVVAVDAAERLAIGHSYERALFARLQRTTIPGTWPPGQVY
jgi:hypothetical protein